VTAATSLRHRVYLQLEPSARAAAGLSLPNKIITVMILVAAAAAILETEPLVSAGRETWFAILEDLFGIIFLVEYVTRIWVAIENPRFAKYRFPRLRYAVSPIAIIDLLAIVPTLLAWGGGGALVLRFFRILRLLRLAKLGRASTAFKHLTDAAYARRYEFGLTLAILVVAVLISGSLLYWAEADAQPDKFGSIPRSLWWAIVTLTTVGYGDAYPVTVLGRFFAAFITIMGIVVIALPAGIFAASFSDALQKRQDAAAERNSQEGDG
jgi:voltage-gated potassium channel